MYKQAVKLLKKFHFQLYILKFNIAEAIELFSMYTVNICYKLQFKISNYTCIHVLTLFFAG